MNIILFLLVSVIFSVWFVKTTSTPKYAPKAERLYNYYQFVQRVRK